MEFYCPFTVNFGQFYSIPAHFVPFIFISNAFFLVIDPDLFVLGSNMLNQQINQIDNLPKTGNSWVGIPREKAIFGLSPHFPFFEYITDLKIWFWNPNYFRVLMWLRHGNGRQWIVAYHLDKLRISSPFFFY